MDFVGDSQLDITPFQRQMFEAEKARQAEEKEERMAEARGGGGGRTQNSMNNQSPPGGGGGGGSGLSQSETVRYINENDGDEDKLSVID